MAKRLQGKKITVEASTTYEPNDIYVQMKTESVSHQCPSMDRVTRQQCQRIYIAKEYLSPECKQTTSTREMTDGI